MIFLDLFLSFFRIGLFSFGGGYAMISLLQQIAVSKSWLTASEFTDIVAISQITPGPIAVNIATFVGFRDVGVLGSLFATLGVTLPSFIIILIAVKFLKKFNDSKLVKDIFYGLRPAICGLIFAATVQIAEPEFFEGFISIENVNFKSVGISIVTFILIYKLKQNPILIILLSAIVGIFLFSF